MRKYMKAAGAILLAAVMMLSACSSSEPEYITLSTTEAEVITTEEITAEANIVQQSAGFTKNASEIVVDMGAGWNLGNTLDAYTYEEVTSDTESLFGNPVTTKTMIDMVKQAGFDSVRIPVTYVNHMDENGNIDEEWLDRVKEVADYVMDNDMYCIINVHHDTGADGWLRADADKLEESSVVFANMWTQIAEKFKDYNDHLLFEGYNEILNSECKWSWAGEDAYNTSNALNQTFVDTVRASGGNNESRYLIVNTYAASAEEEVILNFVMPKDTITGHMIAEVHTYASYDNLDGIFERLKTNFTDKNIPVIVGEFAISRNSSLEDRINYADHFAYLAAQNDIGYFWWDDGNYSVNTTGLTDVCNYALLNRNLYEWAYPEIVSVLVNK